MRQGWPRRYYLAIILSGLVLAGVLALLISRNYWAQVELQEIALKNLWQGLEKHAAAVSYFYAERENDLKNLVESRELSIYFENKALGMSMTYGLRASLIAIQKSFDQLRMERRLNGDFIYSSLVFINNVGECLAASLDNHDQRIRPETWKRFLAPESYGPMILVESLEGDTEVVISTPYFFKGGYAGQLLAMVATEVVKKHLVSEASSNFIYTLTYKGNQPLPCCFLDSKALSFAPDPDDARKGGYKRLKVHNHGDVLKDMVAAWAPIPHTPFYLLGLWPEARILGHSSPWNLLIVLGSLSLLSLVGLGMVWRASTRTLVLNARLEEATCREQEIQEKNLQLKKEKAAAEAASKAKSQFLANMSHESVPR